jgi:circadian clock protein KaiC
LPRPGYLEALGRVTLELQDFVQRLALHLTAWEATTFLVGEFAEPESQDHPVYTIADSLILLSQKTEPTCCVGGCAPPTVDSPGGRW